MKIAMAQINTSVGDLEGNVKKIADYMRRAKAAKADLVMFPELAITGYPPQDLLLEKNFIRANIQAMKSFAKLTKGIAAVVGFVNEKSGRIYNAAAVFSDGKLVRIVHKALLPTYDVFDEARYFTPAKNDDIQPVVVNMRDKRVSLGVEICEDLWDSNYETKVTDLLAKNADLIVNISSSPFHVGKGFERQKLLKEKIKKNKVPIFYVNLVSGQDELVFDGQSLAFDRAGNLIALGKQFEEDFIIAEIDLKKGSGKKIRQPAYSKEEETFNALAFGLRDYFRKTGFRKAVIGLSGGIDSSLTACIAVEALGKQNVIGLSMPSRFSSDHSKTDAQKLAKNLGIHIIGFSIEDVLNAYKKTLTEPLESIRKKFRLTEGSDHPVADENLQPRIRGNCLMDVSNRLKDLKILVLNTGNKTELALGYCTLYGDMSGGISVLGDVNKLDVYKLAKYYNKKSRREMIPRSVFLKKPSPELKKNHFTPFDFSVVDPLVDEIMENHRSKKELIRLGYPKKIVEDVYCRIRRSEYKRRQAAPCIKIAQKSFGIGWRMPIVNQYDD